GGGRAEGGREGTAGGSRVEVAVWTGYAGRPEEAVPEWRALAEDADRVPGQERFARDVRRNQAYWEFVAGQPTEGLATLNRVCAEIGRGTAEPNAYELAAFVALAHGTGQLGEPAEALGIARAAAQRCAAHLGAGHEVARASRYEVARWTAECGHPDDARYAELLADTGRALGEDHWLTRACSAELNRWAATPPGAPPDPLDWWREFTRW